VCLHSLADRLLLKPKLDENAVLNKILKQLIVHIAWHKPILHAIDLPPPARQASHLKVQHLPDDLQGHWQGRHVDQQGGGPGVDLLFYLFVEGIILAAIEDLFVDVGGDLQAC
jgi:hypothetical protein